MNSLRNLANEKVKKERKKKDDVYWEDYRESLNNLNDEIQGQRLMILELEEANGVITQENEWLQEEVSLLKSQVNELECMIYGERIRYYNHYHPRVPINLTA